MTSDEQREKAIAFLQSPREAMRISAVVIETLNTVEGYDDIPRKVQTIIEQRCAVIYASGFTRGVRKAKEIESEN